MTTVDKAVAIIAGIAGEKATAIVAALAKARIGFVATRASADMFRRFHAHARYLGDATGYGYRDIYNGAVAYAMERGEWPTRMMALPVTVAGWTVMTDVEIPESTTRASNKQLTTAYEYVSATAEEHGIALPEHTLIGE